ncbi:tubulin-like doman-containing protein [Deinococcus radiodurans]|nr:tubulin-like doman-containing protein [Deinococcus radiodurans]
MSQRVARLRNLTEAQAKAALNKDNAGLEMSVQFAVNQASGQTGVRVIVVGTLCGGTCSGTASDVGILLRTILSEEEKTLGCLPCRILTWGSPKNPTRKSGKRTPITPSPN